jgi:hypothetical protein
MDAYELGMAHEIDTAFPLGPTGPTGGTAIVGEAPLYALAGATGPSDGWHPTETISLPQYAPAPIVTGVQQLRPLPLELALVACALGIPLVVLRLRHVLNAYVAAGVR